MMDIPCEFIEITEINPFLSKCIIKVLYVSETEKDYNRNKTVITKEAARKIAQSLPGSPIVGYFNSQEKDYEEHNESFSIVGNEIRMKDDTVPYGFVDLNAKVWFKKYLDDDTIEREYLVTEGWLWTGQYPDAQRIIDSPNGNNQSMKLYNGTQAPTLNVQGEWTKDINGKNKFFIINKAIIENLCILGENYEPCFEGANISRFSLSKDFEDKMTNIFTQMKDIMEKGGTQSMYIEKVIAELEAEQVLDDPETSFKKKEADEDKKEKSDSSNSDNKTEDDSKEENSDKKDDDSSKEEKDSSEDKESKDDEKEEEDDKKKKKNKFSLDEIPEYVELQARFAELTTNFDELTNKFSSLEQEAVELRNFKAEIEKGQKEEMIAKFFMLEDSDETKTKVINNIDSYSLKEIESELAVACFRKGISFNLEDDNNKEESVNTYRLGADIYDDSEEESEWVKAVLATQAKLDGNI